MAQLLLGHSPRSRILRPNTFLLRWCPHWVPITVIALSVSCANDSESDDAVCSPIPCPSATLNGRLLSGKITVSINGSAPEAFEVGNLCDSSFRSAVYERPTDTPPTQEVVIGPTLHCSEGKRELSLTLRSLGDPRRLMEGERVGLAPGAGVQISGTNLGLNENCTFTVTNSAWGQASLDVTRATGTAAPFPDFVTPDYARRFLAHVEVIQQDGTCGEIKIIADFEAEQTAADISVHTDTICGACG